MSSATVQKITVKIADVSTATGQYAALTQCRASQAAAAISASDAATQAGNAATSAAQAAASAALVPNVGTDPGDISTNADADAKYAPIAHASDTTNPHEVTKAQVGLGSVLDAEQIPASYLDADTSLAANSDVKVATQKATKSYVDARTPTGVVKDYLGSSAPTGYVLASGRTIGNAASSATERANADTEALFTLLWDSMADAEAAVSGGRGASAAADYAANKTIALPDLRGRVTAGKDDMGGSAANRLTSANGLDGTVLGKAGGTQTHTLTSAEMPSHHHAYGTATNYGANGTYYSINPGASGSAQSTTDTGGGGAHNNTQPTIVLNKIIKL